MSKIIYKPHCDKCGFPIDTSEGEVMYQDVYEGNTESATLTRKIAVIISPDRCEHCGAPFDSIEIRPPKQLPDTFLGA